MATSEVGERASSTHGRPFWPTASPCRLPRVDPPSAKLPGELLCTAASTTAAAPAATICTIATNTTTSEERVFLAADSKRTAEQELRCDGQGVSKESNLLTAVLFLGRECRANPNRLTEWYSVLKKKLQSKDFAFRYSRFLALMCMRLGIRSLHRTATHEAVSLVCFAREDEAP